MQRPREGEENGERRGEERWRESRGEVAKEDDGAKKGLQARAEWKSRGETCKGTSRLRRPEVIA